MHLSFKGADAATALISYYAILILLVLRQFCLLPKSCGYNVGRTSDLAMPLTADIAFVLLYCYCSVQNDSSLVIFPAQ